MVVVVVLEVVVAIVEVVVVVVGEVLVEVEGSSEVVGAGAVVERSDVGELEQETVVTNRARSGSRALARIGLRRLT